MIPEGTTMATVIRPDPGETTDNAGGNLIMGHNWPTNNQFPIGSTEVTNTVMDSAGNMAECTFNVVVAGKLFQFCYNFEVN